MKDIIQENFEVLSASEFCTQLLVNAQGYSLLTSHDIAALASQVDRVQYAAGQRIFTQGEPGNSAYIIIRGTVRGKVSYGDLRQTKTFEMGTGTLFGEISLLTELARTATVEAVSAVDLVELSQTTFSQVLALHPDIPEILMNLVAKRRQDDADTWQKLAGFSAQQVEKTLDRKNVLRRFLGILLDRNIIPQSFPELPQQLDAAQPKTLVQQILSSEFCTTFLVDGAGNPLLSELELAELVPHLHQLHLQPGKTIVQQGEPGETAYIILSGTVKGRVEYQDPEVDRSGVFERGSGSLVGEMSLFTGLPRAATLYTEEAVELVEVTQEGFSRLLILRPEIVEIIADLVDRRRAEDTETLQRLKNFQDTNVTEVLSRNYVLGRLHRLSFEKLGIYARIPYNLLHHMTVAASDRVLGQALASLYLSGNFAPIRQEITVEHLPVVGALPPDLSGIFLRNGPNPQFPPIGHYHWFDGDGMVHSVQINQGKASYRNRYVRTKGFLAEQQEGRAIWPGLLNLPRFDFPHGLLMKNVSNTAFVWHHNVLLSLWESGEPYLLKLPDLETVGPYTFGDTLPCAFTAHPKVDPVTQEMMFFGYSPIVPPHLQYGIVAPNGKVSRLVEIKLPEPRLIHDFAITEHYTLFLDLPLLLKPSKLLQGEVPLVFDRTLPSRLGVIPRYGDTEDIQWFPIPTCMVLHVANAYEEGDEVVLVACPMKSTNLGIPFYDDGNLVGLQLEGLSLYEWRLNLKQGTVNGTVLAQEPMEFPQFDPRRVRQKIRYVYGLHLEQVDGHPLTKGLVKVDLETRSVQRHRLSPGRSVAGEAVFVPRSPDSPEEAGYLLCFIHDEVEARSEFAVFDACALEAGPIAQVLIPQRVPYGFHAIWVAHRSVVKRQ